MGEYTAQDMQEASDKALAQLVSQISVTVSSLFVNIQTEVNLDYNEKTTGVVQSYATATLRNVHTFRDQCRDGYYVFHYISREEVAAIFAERELLVRDIFHRAERFEKDLNYTYALKWYYNALVLANSIPKASVVIDEINLTTEIPVRIRSIIDRVNFEMTEDVRISDKEREITLFVHDNKKPIRRLSFSFWDG